MNTAIRRIGRPALQKLIPICFINGFPTFLLNIKLFRRWTCFASRC